jgi:Cysteine-rich secretory protein family
VARTPSFETDQTCKTYALAAGTQLAAMKAKNCPAPPPRWDPNPNAHYLFCLADIAGGHTNYVSERKARDDAIAACQGQAQAAGAAPNCAPNAGDPVPSQWADMLNAHNVRRKLHCACPLSWSASLASDAQAYASQCIIGKHGINGGENLADAWTLNAGAPVIPAESNKDAYEKTWYCEVNNYPSYTNPVFVGGFTTNCGAGNFPKVNGHFVQVVRKDAMRVGCGVANCSMTDDKGIARQGTHWVCRYLPANSPTDTATLVSQVSPPVCK